MTFSEDLLAWYEANAAALPWRQNRDPYRVWLSEIMLQQTQVTAVIPYFERFISEFPTVDSLANAPLDRVLKLWEGLGYYSRARNLHRAAQKIAQDLGGIFPQTATELEALPGIGRYTAAAIASIAFGEHVAVLDGNVMRVLSRLEDLDQDITESTTQKQLWTLAETFLGNSNPSTHNQAMMELGRTICRPRAPLCLICPVATHCRAFAHGTQTLRPVKPRKAPTPHYDVAAGVIVDTGGKFLIAQRKAEGLLGGLWEFPGGKQEKGETLEECLQRELVEELAIRVNVGKLIATVNHAFTHFKITLYAFHCDYRGAIDGNGAGDPQAIDCAGWRWVDLQEIDQFAFGKADLDVIKVLKVTKSSHGESQ